MLKRVRSLGRKTVLAINIAAACAILLAYLATEISPERFPYLAFFGIAYGFFLITNLGFAIFWLFFKKGYALISSIAILIGFGHLSSYFQLLPDLNQVDVSGNTIRVVSQNVRLFGWYNWSENIANRDDIMANLERINGDIYCLQEFFHHSGPGIFETKELFKLVSGSNYLHDEYTTTVNKTQHYGIAIYSKFPMIGKGQIRFEGEKSNNMCIYADLDLFGDTVRVYNAHVASIRFTDTHYAFVEDLNSEKEKSEVDLSGAFSIARRLGAAFRRRANQVELIKDHANKSPYPVIICGDFNDTPVSYSYAAISDGLKDAFRGSGAGIGNTYIGVFPSFRIDYIFHSPEIKSLNYTTHPEEVSDHHAISCDLILP